MELDLIVRRGRVFDGSGGPSRVADVGIKDGRVAAVEERGIDGDGAARVIDAEDQWVTPGFLDIHTHYDAEVLAEPGLGESVRHGVTTVMVGSCSLGTVHVDPEDAADLFSRVEAVPHEHVLRLLRAHRDWTDAGGYVEALERLALGPNVMAMLGHSDARAAAMGLDRSTDRSVIPSEAEMRTMEGMLSDALDVGFVGLSEQRNPWDRLDGERYRSRTLPSTYARWREYRRLHRTLRRRGRVLQSIPDLTKPYDIVPYLLTSTGLRGRPALRTSLLTAADVRSNPLTHRIFGPAARLANGPGRGDFRWQHVPAPFRVFADGIDLVVFEELAAGAEALHLRDAAERHELMASTGYRERFRADVTNRWSPRVWDRRMDHITIIDCPDGALVGRTVAAVASERGTDPVDTFLDLLIEHGPALRWTTVISNHRPEVLDRLSALPEVQIGFADSGAHLRNMAFYNFGLHLLHRVRTRGFMSPERAVHRLTGELADWWGVDAGHLRVGDRADLVVIDPAGLDDSVTEHHEAPVECFGGLRRMVNRNDAAVTAVVVAGTELFGRGRFTEAFGSRRTGRFLRAGEPSGRVDPATVTSPSTAA